MASVPFKKELFISSCLSSPPWVDDMMRRVREQQEQQFMKDLFKVPVFKVNAENYEIDYFKQLWICYDNYIKPNCIVKIEKENNKMEAKKCDRCGKLYEVPGAYENGNGAEVIFKHKWVNGSEDMSGAAITRAQTSSVRIMYDNGFGHKNDVDFCPDCRKAFKKWFEEG